MNEVTCLVCKGEFTPLTDTQNICGQHCFDKVKHTIFTECTGDLIDEFSIYSCDECNTNLAGVRYAKLLSKANYGKKPVAIFAQSICIDCFDSNNDY